MDWEDNDETEFESALTMSFKTPFLLPSTEREREWASSHLSRLYTAVLQLSDSRQERAAWQLSVTPALAFAGRRENACKGRTECWILLILQEGFLSTNYSKVALLWGNSLSSRIHTLTPFCPWGENKHWRRTVFVLRVYWHFKQMKNAGLR